MKLDEQGMPEGYPLRDGWEISPRRVRAMLDRGADLLLLDCRLPKEHAVARIDGAMLIPMQELAGRMDELVKYADHKVVVFCHAGVRSMRVTGFLREQGFGEVSSMAGGIDLWSLTVDDSVPRY
ncbi:MAG: rhodanese-like domain-containing protein [Planctomycetota bacterium]